MNVVALIPAYNPTHPFVALVRALASSEFSAVVVVNDGSARDFDAVFQEIGKLDHVTVLRHAVNLGKGAALKTGFNHVCCHLSDRVGVVTVDADGQHLVEDALKVGRLLEQRPGSLVLGARAFDENVPLRSQVGNHVTRALFRFLIGQKITDTQSGLRGIPLGFLPSLLKVDSRGYEFELDMLLACKVNGRPIVEQAIRTVYLEGNKSSHFNPLFDSMKIYFVLFRFTITSLLSALIDNLVFVLVYSFTANILASQTSARVLATTFNYLAVKKTVFYSKESAGKTLPGYLLLVCVSGIVSYLLIRLLVSFSPLSVVLAKICAESLVFVANFAVQRDLIFTGSRDGPGEASAGR